MPPPNALKNFGRFEVTVTEADPPDPCTEEYETTELTPSLA